VLIAVASEVARRYPVCGAISSTSRMPLTIRMLAPSTTFSHLKWTQNAPGE
jgi:hypothetical protein